MTPSPSWSLPGTYSALRIAFIYAVFSTLWILFSDMAVDALFTEAEEIVRVGMLKGWLFVAITAALLFVLINRLLTRIRSEQLRQEELHSERLRTLLLVESIAESSDDAIFAKDLQGRYTLFNSAAARFVGKPAGEVIGYDDRSIFPPKQAEVLIAAGRDVIAQNRIVTRRERLTTSAGERVFLATKGPLHDADGRVTGIFGISRDITENHEAEEKLRDREEKLAAIVGYSPSALSLKTPDGRYALANPNLQRIHGLQEPEIVGKTDFDLYPAEMARSFRDNDELVLATRSRHSIEETIPVDGVERTYLSHMFPVLGESGEVRFICRISLDITERKRADAAVKELTDDLNATLHAIPDLLFELDGRGRYIKVEASAAHLLAAPPGELLGHTIEEKLPAEAAATIRAAIDRASRSGTDYGCTITLPQADGERHFELSVARKGLGNGESQRFVILSRNITERRNVELELRRNNEELERFNSAAIGRELQMLALKRQVNALSRELGRTPPYDLSFADTASGGELP